MMVVTETRGEGASLGRGRVLWKCSGGSAILVCTDSEDGFADNGAYVDGIVPSCGFDRAISSYTPKARGESGFGAQWAGQGAPLARQLPAARLVEELATEMERALSSVGRG
jgi:hypothetical protein